MGLLVLNLKRRTASLKPGEKYQSNYALKVQQHPMITLLQSSSVNMNDVANKIHSICNHHDKQQVF